MSKIADMNQNGNGVRIEEVKEPGRQVKCILVSSVGINFLVTRELYSMVLSTGDLINGKTFQGRKFTLQPTEKEKDLLMEK